MKKPSIVIALATFFVLLYQASPIIGFPDELIIGMFILSPFIVVYMVYVVLKYGKPSGHTFEEKFYEDHDYKRNE